MLREIIVKIMVALLVGVLGIALGTGILYAYKTNLVGTLLSGPAGPSVAQAAAPESSPSYGRNEDLSYGCPEGRMDNAVYVAPEEVRQASLETLRSMLTQARSAGIDYRDDPDLRSDKRALDAVILSAERAEGAGDLRMRLDRREHCLLRPTLERLGTR